MGVYPVGNLVGIAAPDGCCLPSPAPPVRGGAGEWAVREAPEVVAPRNPIQNEDVDFEHPFRSVEDGRSRRIFRGPRVRLNRREALQWA
jgi:hypothetical protein